jgi:predicted transcriptional regulator
VVTIELDSVAQERLDGLARLQGQDSSTLARRILLDYLDFQALPPDTAEDWAAASIALSPEVLEDSGWDDLTHDS